MVLGFSFTGGVIPAGCGTLVELELDGDATGLSGIIISDAIGTAIDFNYYDSGSVEPCDDETACNYGADGDCEYADYECDNGDLVCNENDCEDDPGGEINDGCDLPDLNLYLTDSGEVFYNSSSDIGGFQFIVDGTTVSGASGGAAADAGFTVSNSATTVVGFSLTGSTIAAGSGVLVVLEVDGDASEACLDGLVLSDSSGNAIDATVEGCTSIVEEGDDDVYGCTDMDACNYNADATADDGSCDYGSMCWDGSYECDDSDCPDQPGGSVDVHYNSDTPIAGFQFYVAGVDVTGAGGGAAGDAGMIINHNSNNHQI